MSDENRDRVPTRPAAEPSQPASLRALIVTPTYNEAENLEPLVRRFFAAVPDLHLLVVDDDSPDGTADRCTALKQEFPRLDLLLRRGEPRGLGRAYLAGLGYGMDRGFEVVGTMDADQSHSPEHLPAMLTMARTHDVVIGSRYVRDGGTINWRLRRILLSWLANRFAGTLLRLPARDLTSGFRLYRSETLARVPLDEITSNGYSFLVEMLYRLHRASATLGESPIVFYDRTLGKSKLASREIYVGALRLLALRVRLGRPRARR